MLSFLVKPGKSNVIFIVEGMEGVDVYDHLLGRYEHKNSKEVVVVAVYLHQGSSTFCMSRAKKQFYNVMAGRTFSSYLSSSSHTN